MKTPQQLRFETEAQRKADHINESMADGITIAIISFSLICFLISII